MGFLEAIGFWMAKAVAEFFLFVILIGLLLLIYWAASK